MRFEIFDDLTNGHLQDLFPREWNRSAGIYPLSSVSVLAQKVQEDTIPIRVRNSKRPEIRHVLSPYVMYDIDRNIDNVMRVVYLSKRAKDLSRNR